MRLRERVARIWHLIINSTLCRSCFLNYSSLGVAQCPPLRGVLGDADAGQRSEMPRHRSRLVEGRTHLPCGKSKGFFAWSISETTSSLFQTLGNATVRAKRSVPRLSSRRPPSVCRRHQQWGFAHLLAIHIAEKYTNVASQRPDYRGGLPIARLRKDRGLCACASRRKHLNREAG